MFTNLKILESVPCKKVYFPMLHGFSCLAPFYIADSISYLHSLILSKLKQNKSLKRIFKMLNAKCPALCSLSQQATGVRKRSNSLMSYCKHLETEKPKDLS